MSAFAPPASGSAAAAVASLVGVSLVTGVGMFLYTRRFQRIDDQTVAMTRVRRAFRVGLPAAYVVALLAMAVAGWIHTADAVVSVLPGSASAVGLVLQAIVVSTPPVAAAVAGYFGAFPTVTAVRDVDVSAVTVAGRLARYIAGLVALVTALGVAAVLAVGELGFGLGLLLATPVLVLALLVGSPWLVRLTQSTREPTEAERDRLDSLCEAAGLDVRRVRVLDYSDTGTAVGLVRGVSSHRHLFLTDDLLAFDDDLLRAYLAVQAGKVRVMHSVVRMILPLGLAAIALWQLLSSLNLVGVLAALVVLGVGGAGQWIGRGLVYRADAYAAERAGRDAVAAAIRRTCEHNDIPLEWGRVAQFRGMTPSPAQRLDRLGDREASEPDSP